MCVYQQSSVNPTSVKSIFQGQLLPGINFPFTGAMIGLRMKLNRKPRFVLAMSNQIGSQSQPLKLTIKLDEPRPCVRYPRLSHHWHSQKENAILQEDSSRPLQSHDFAMWCSIFQFADLCKAGSWFRDKNISRENHNSEMQRNDLYHHDSPLFLKPKCTPRFPNFIL